MNNIIADKILTRKTKEEYLAFIDLTKDLVKKYPEENKSLFTDIKLPGDKFQICQFITLEDGIKKNTEWWQTEFVTKLLGKNKKEVFQKTELDPGQPETEIVRVPGLVGKHLNNEVTQELLEDVMNSEPTAQTSMVNQDSI